MSKPDEDEFFIGYAPPMPRRLAHFVVRVIITIGALALVWAVALAAGHVRLEGGTFEFGRPGHFSGTIIERPYPAVRLDGQESRGMAIPLLVGPGKHGADVLIRGMGGRHVAFTGTRIQRGAHTMIEIEPGSFGGSDQPLTDPESEPVVLDKLVELTGEVVDSKCFLGVMVPGSGKTHKECASLCLRGGIPPALYVQDRAGHSVLLLLTGARGESTSAAAIEVAGETISVTGSVQRQDGWLVLRSDPASWRRRE